MTRQKKKFTYSMKRNEPGMNNTHTGKVKGLEGQFEDAPSDLFSSADANNQSGKRRSGKRKQKPRFVLVVGTKEGSKKKRKDFVKKRITHSCGVCGRHDFVTALGATRHQASCDGTSNPDGPWMCQACGKSNFSTSQAFCGHVRCCGGASSSQQRTLTLSPKECTDKYERLSDYNKIICQSLELFEATPLDVHKQMMGNGKRHILVGNIGIRCKYCAKNGTMVIGSMLYTHELKNMPHNMYTLVKRHILGGTCKNIPSDITQAIPAAKKVSTSQSGMKNGLGLPAYLRLLSEHYALTDYGKKDGVFQKNDPPILVSGDGGSPFPSNDATRNDQARDQPILVSGDGESQSNDTTRNDQTQLVDLWEV